MIFTLPPSFFFFYFFVVVLRRPCVAHGTINFFYCSWDDKFHLLAKSSSSSPSSNVHCSHYQVAQYNPKTPNSILVPTLRNITPLSSVISPMAGVTWGGTLPAGERFSFTMCNSISSSNDYLRFAPAGRGRKKFQVSDR